MKEGGGGEEVSTPDRLVRVGKPITWPRTHSPAVPHFTQPAVSLLSADEPQHGKFQTLPQLDGRSKNLS